MRHILAILSTLVLFLIDTTIPWLTCDQLEFCRKIRHLKPTTDFSLDINSVRFIDNCKIELVLTKTNSENMTFQVIGYANGNFRFTIINNGTKHHPVNQVFSGAPETSTLKFIQEGGILVIENDSGKILLQPNPIFIQIFKHNVLVTVINYNGFMVINNGEDDNSIALDFHFPQASRGYGIPEHAEYLSLKNTRSGKLDPYRLYNADNPGYKVDSRDPLYGTVPVFYGHGTKYSSGIFWLNTGQTFADVKVEKNKVGVFFISESGWIDFIALTGPSLEESIKQYSILTGCAPLPPYFTLGYHQSRYSYNDQNDVEEVVQKFGENQFPMDVIWLDIGYTNKKKYFTWDYKLFPNPIEMQNKLNELGKKMVAIIDPHVKIETGYFVYDEGNEHNYFVKNPDGSNYIGECWPGNSTWIDFLQKDAAQWYANLYQLDKFNSTTLNLHIWNDMNEPAVFKTSEKTFPNNVLHNNGEYSHMQIHNIYGLSQVRATYEGLMKRSNEMLRPFILTRSHFAGTQRYAAIWTGDNAATWDHLRISIPMCLTEALAGLSFCGADVGGFVNNPEVELLQRWYQVGAWLPFFRGHSDIHTKRHEPYLFPKDVQNRIRKAIEQRYFHLPYWYTLFWEHSIYGVPVIRPITYHYYDDANTLDIDYEWLIGPNVLVSPVLEQNASYIEVYLPGGEDAFWYDSETNVKYKGTGNKTVLVDLESTPVYYKGGSIIPRRDLIKLSSRYTWEDPINLHIFLNSQYEAKGTLYVDDYESFKYRNNEYLYLQFQYKNDTLISENAGNNTILNKEVKLGNITIYGLNDQISKVTVSNENACLNINSTYLPSNVFKIAGLIQDLRYSFNLNFSYK